jgi:hypothetical protein
VISFLAAIAHLRQLLAAGAPFFALSVGIYVAIFVAEIIAAFVVVASGSAFIAGPFEVVLISTFIALLEPVAFSAALVALPIGHVGLVLVVAAATILIDTARFAALVTLGIAAMLFATRIALNEPVAFLIAFVKAFLVSLFPVKLFFVDAHVWLLHVRLHHVWETCLIPIFSELHLSIIASTFRLCNGCICCYSHCKQY